MENLSEFLRGWLLAEESAFDSILLKRKYIDICGGNMHDGVMLSQIMFWHGNNKETGKPRLQIFKDDHYWLAKSHQDWWKECRINEHTSRKCIDRLEALGVIETRIWKFAGSPTKHIRMVWERFEELIRELPEDDDGEKSVLTSKAISPLRSNPIDTTGQIQSTSEVRSICDLRSDPIHRLPTENTTETTSEITLLLFENEKVEITSGLDSSQHPLGSDSRGESQSKSNKSRNNKGKGGRNKNLISKEVEQEYQPLLDLYNQEKPPAWDKAHSLTNSRLTGLQRYEEKYGRDRMVEMMRRALLGAKRTKMATFPWSIDVLLKDDKEWFVQFVEKTNDGEIDSPRVEFANSPANDKMARLMEKNMRAMQLLNGGSAA